MYKIDRRGGGVQKSFTRTDPKYRSKMVIYGYRVRSDDYLECLSRSWSRLPSLELQSGWGCSRIKGL